MKIPLSIGEDFDFGCTNNCRIRVMPTNRTPILFAVALGIITSVGISAEEIPPPPDPRILQAGDLLWPKKPDSLILYSSNSEETIDQDRVRWQKERDDWLEKMRLKKDPSEDEKRRYHALESMTYDEFVSFYFSGQPMNQPSDYGTGGVSVGHVAIVNIEEGVPHVIEALMNQGVKKTSYSNWLKARKGMLIWVGRLRNTNSAKRRAVAAFAATQLGKRYDFWNFDLADESGFYCSKLAWLSIMKETGVSMDDDLDPNRLLWYSPKQLMNSRHLDLIINPGAYGRR